MKSPRIFALILLGMLLILPVTMPAGIKMAGSKIKAASKDEKRRSKIEKMVEKADSALSCQFGSRTITVCKVPFSKGIRGKRIDDRELPALARKIFQDLKVLPTALIERSRVKYIRISSQLVLQKKDGAGGKAGGFGGGDTIFITKDSVKEGRTIFHEFFHSFDKNDQGEWESLNHPQFVYTGSSLIKIELSRGQKRQMTRNVNSNRFVNDFVTRYAMSFPGEDRAETFSFMIKEGPKFLERTKKSPVLKAKMEYIIRVTEEKEFWQRHLGLAAETDTSNTED